MFNIFLQFKSRHGGNAILASGVTILHGLVCEDSILLFVLTWYWGDISLEVNFMESFQYCETDLVI